MWTYDAELSNELREIEYIHGLTLDKRRIRRVRTSESALHPLADSWMTIMFNMVAPPHRLLREACSVLCLTSFEKWKGTPKRELQTMAKEHD